VPLERAPAARSAARRADDRSTTARVETVARKRSPSRVEGSAGSPGVGIGGIGESTPRLKVRHAIRACAQRTLLHHLGLWNRRSFLTATLGAAAGAAGSAEPGRPPTRAASGASARDWARPEPVQPDPDIVAPDTRFRNYIVGNTVIRRLQLRRCGPKAWRERRRRTGLERHPQQRADAVD
jgi:hypothetical protein